MYGPYVCVLLYAAHAKWIFFYLNYLFSYLVKKKKDFRNRIQKHVYCLDLQVICCGVVGALEDSRTKRGQQLLKNIQMVNIENEEQL